MGNDDDDPDGISVELLTLIIALSIIFSGIMFYLVSKLYQKYKQNKLLKERKVQLKK